MTADYDRLNAGSKRSSSLSMVIVKYYCFSFDDSLFALLRCSLKI